MATMRQKRIAYFTRNGFFPAEAQELSRTSWGGMRASYFMFMVRSRRRLFENAKRYNWSESQYRDYVKKLYVDAGFLKTDTLGRMRVDVWAMLRDYEELSRRRGEEYESPWKRKLYRKSTAKKEVKRVTRKDMLRSWIKQIERSIERTTSERKRQQLMEQKANLEEQRKAMGG